MRGVAGVDMAAPSCGRPRSAAAALAPAAARGHARTRARRALERGHALRAQGGHARADVLVAGIAASHLLEEVERLAPVTQRLEDPAQLEVELGGLLVLDVGAVERLLVMQERLGGDALGLVALAGHGQREDLRG